jgi:hypothetical protein
MLRISTIKIQKPASAPLPRVARWQEGIAILDKLDAAYGPHAGPARENPGDWIPRSVAVQSSPIRANFRISHNFDIFLPRCSTMNPNGLFCPEAIRLISSQRLTTSRTMTQ